MHAFVVLFGSILAYLEKTMASYSFKREHFKITYYM
jgi:hypothetical protein